MSLRANKKMARLGAFAGMLLFALGLMVPARADVSITAYPSEVNMIGRSQVTLHLLNGGDTAYIVRAVASASWLVLSQDHVKIRPGQTVTLTVRVKKASPRGEQGVTFLVPPPPTGTGVGASGALEVPLDFNPAASPQGPPATIVGPDGGWLSWPMLAILGIFLAIGIGSMLGSRRRRASRHYGF
jgi:hypothetical protein